MRKLLLFAFVVISQITFAQKKNKRDTVGLHTPFVNGEVVYQKTFKAPGKSTEAIFNSSHSWFEQRYKDLDSVQVQDAAAGHLVARGKDTVTFKGPLGASVPSKVLMTIDINAQNGSYNVSVSKIVLGYQEDPSQPRTYFTAEDLINHLLGKKYPKGSFDPVPFNKKRSKKALESLNGLVQNVMTSLDQSIK